MLQQGMTQQRSGLARQVAEMPALRWKGLRTSKRQEWMTTRQWQLLW